MTISLSGGRALCAALLLFCASSFAQDLSLLPKYGNAQKTAQQKAADATFVAQVNARYAGDMTRAANDVAATGWKLLREGKEDDAMRRFNQAWLLNAKNPQALWGMAAVSGNTPQGLAASLKLFAEAQKLLPDDIDLEVDYARVVGIAAAAGGNKAMQADALKRYDKIYQKAPSYTLNLQNWAIADYARGDYRAAWTHLKLAEATPQSASIDPEFVKALEAKMPRPAP